MNRLLLLPAVVSALIVFPLVDSAVKGTVVLLLATVACLILRRDSAVTRLFIRACGLAMARSSSLHGRLTAVLCDKQIRRSVTTGVAFLSLYPASLVAVPIAMLKAANDPQDETGISNIAPGSQLSHGLEQHLDWGEPVDGLRAALMIRKSQLDPQPSESLDVYLVVQNVSDTPIRFCDTTGEGKVSGTEIESDADATGLMTLNETARRTLYIRLNGEPLAGISSSKLTRTDYLLQPRDVAYIRFFRHDASVAEPQRSGTVIAEGVVRDPSHSLSAVLNIIRVPDGAWTGKLMAPPTRGAFAALGPMPDSEEGQKLFRYCVDHARLNHDIPGGLVRCLHNKVQEFIRNNTGDQFGDPYAKTMQLLLPQVEQAGDWRQADLVTLIDAIAAVTTIPLETTLEEIRQNTLQRGQQMPAALNSANWGESLPGGLRMAWLLEPRAKQYHLGTALKSRVFIHNSGTEPVAFVTRSFHQPQHKSETAGGVEVRIESTYWMTLGRPEAWRLHPGEYCEVYAPGIGVGPRNEDNDDWANIRPGSWILADEDDEILFEPGAVILSGDHNLRVNPDWWLEFVRERIRRDAPLPEDPKEREVILCRVVQDLFGSSPTPEEAASFCPDTSPEALENLAELLSNRSWLTSVAGPIEGGKTKFLVLPEDPEASTRPRVAKTPGRYNLGEELRFVVTRRSSGERIVNEADLVWYPAGKDSVFRNVPLPDNYDSWAAAWEPGSTMLWVQQKSGFRSYNFASPAHILEEDVEPERVPVTIRDSLSSALIVPDVPDAPQAPVAAPASQVQR